MIDTQTHYVPPQAATLIERLQAQIPVHGIARNIDPAAPIFGLDERLRAMDEAGVEVAVLSPAPIGLIADRDRRIDLCRANNDGLLAACAAWPDRFVTAAMLPLPDGNDAIAELERVRGEDRVRAIFIVAQATLYRPDDSALEGLFAIAADAGLPVIIHPTAGVADLAPEFDAYGLGSGLHAMISHALVAARIMQSGLMDRIEGLELILTHLGGVLPFLIERLDNRHRGPTRFPPSHYLRHRLFLDNCGYPAGPALRCTFETVGPGRMVMGSDWPSRPIAPAIESIRSLGLELDAEEAILGGNAARWFDPRRSRIP
jgi:predicted TIM-barrel fold metal-dependent hydrolase